MSTALFHRDLRLPKLLCLLHPFVLGKGTIGIKYDKPTCIIMSPRVDVIKVGRRDSPREEKSLEPAQGGEIHVVA